MLPPLTLEWDPDLIDAFVANRTPLIWRDGYDECDEPAFAIGHIQSIHGLTTIVESPTGGSVWHFQFGDWTDIATSPETLAADLEMARSLA